MATIKAKAKLNKKKAIRAAIALTKHVKELATPNLWIHFDEEADLLYVGLKKPPRVTETVDLDEDGILLDYRGKDLVGITVLGASSRN